jgi:hypothetical protein
MLVCAAWITAAAPGCALVLGIEDANLDPLGGGGQAGSGSGSDASTVDAAGGEDGCALYCETVLSNCQGEHAVYASPEICTATCAFFEPGTAGDASGNTVACRTRHATLARSTGEPGSHCPAAGPGGDGSCGSNCEGYCTVFMRACLDFFGSQAACLDDCASAVPDLGGFDTSFTSGNSLQCRLYHVSAASVDPATHCHHAAGHAVCL